MIAAVNGTEHFLEIANLDNIETHQMECPWIVRMTVPYSTMSYKKTSTTFYMIANSSSAHNAVNSLTRTNPVAADFRETLNVRLPVGHHSLG